MVDPISVGGGAKPGADLFKEANKSLQNAQEQVSKFEELRSKMEAQEMNQVKGMNPNDAFQIQRQEGPQNAQNVQSTQQVNQLDPSQKVGQDIPKVTDLGSLQQVVDRLKAGQGRLKDLISNATSGKTFSPAELIGLQAEVSQITTEIQMCSKVVEQGVGSIKQTMQMQV
jgi:hypothetical protein